MHPLAKRRLQPRRDSPALSFAGGCVKVASSAVVAVDSILFESLAIC